MKQAIIAAAVLLLFLRNGQIAVQAIDLMDTSGGVAVPSPAISSVPGYPRPSDIPVSVAREKRKPDDAGARRQPAHIALPPAIPVLSPD